jgi:hypothetical protein
VPFPYRIRILTLFFWASEFAKATQIRLCINSKRIQGGAEKNSGNRRKIFSSEELVMKRNISKWFDDFYWPFISPRMEIKADSSALEHLFLALPES